MFDAVAVAVADPSLYLKNADRSAVVAMPFAVAADSLTREPFAVVLIVVCDVPLISAEPRGTRLALADTVADALTDELLATIRRQDAEALLEQDADADASFTPTGSDAAKGASLNANAPNITAWPLSLRHALSTLSLPL